MHHHRAPQSERRDKAYLVMLADLKEKGVSNFNELFERVWPTLKEVYEASGEEMMRLRTYEHLQNLASRGDVDKVGKTYSISAAGERKLLEAAAAEEKEAGDE